MEILTLLKANIRRKKGSFVNVILLTLVIAMSVTTILSINESTLNGVNNAHEQYDTPDIWAEYDADTFSVDRMKKVKNDSRVERVNVVDLIFPDSARIGGKEYSNGSIKGNLIIVKANENTRLLKEDLSGIAENTPKLQKGEIYVSQGFLTNTSGNVGEKIIIETIAGNYEFTLKGILFDPMFGCSQIPIKEFHVNDEDFSEIISAVSKEESGKYNLGKYVRIYKADGCALTDGQFRRQLNIETGVTDTALYSMTRDMSINYTTLFPVVISSVLLVFVMSLLGIVVIVTVHSISVEIETNYVTFGILKAQGFDKNKIRLLFLGQYLLAEMIGAVIGIALSIPLIGAASNIFVKVTAIPPVMKIPTGSIAAILAALFVLSVVSIFFITKKVSKISPVRAISGGKREIYFDSRINAPISGGLLSLSLALRQFTSAKRRYAGTFLIAAILVFFMITMTMLANAVDSKSALESIGAMVTEIDVEPKENLSDKDFKNVENEIERFAKIRKKYYTNYSYFSFAGEDMPCVVYKDPAMFPAPAIEGRTPLYDNEISVSPLLLEEFELKIGDEVTVGWHGKKKTFLITGTVPFASDVGRGFLMSYDAAKKIGYDDWLWGGYSLENGDDDAGNKKISDTLNEKFGDILTASAETELIDKSTLQAIKAMQIIIYFFSVMFSLIVTHMVCSKAFVQERIDIGIYKAVGFKTSQLRSQFAFRFLIVSVLGSGAGGILSYFLSRKLLEILLKNLGIVSVNADIVFTALAIPIFIVCLSFLIFSYLISGKIRKVKIRELVAE